MSRLVAAQESERRRISRELHDQVGQHLTALMLGLKWPGLGKDTPGAQKVLKDLQLLAETIGKEIHDLALKLRPTALDDLGLVPALETFVAEWSQRTGIEVDFLADGWTGPRVSPAIETTLYRIVCEAFNNVLKHANARRVSVILERSERLATAIVEDDGRGFDTERVFQSGDRRLGLGGMQERAALVNGEMSVESIPGRGTTVFVRIPLSAESKPTADV